MINMKDGIKSNKMIWLIEWSRNGSNNEYEDYKHLSDLIHRIW